MTLLMTAAIFILILVNLEFACRDLGDDEYPWWLHVAGVVLLLPFAASAILGVVLLVQWCSS